MTEELFDQTNEPDPIDPNESYVDKLVGEDKKFKDYEALARGKIESDSFIETLKSEMDELRADLKTRLTMEEFMTKLDETEKNQNPSNPNPNPDGEQKSSEKATLSIDEVDQLVERKLSEKEQSTLREDNLKKVMTKLEESWGPNYRKELTNKANELGLGQDWLANLAQEKPNAFLKLVDAERKPNAAGALFTPPVTQVDTAKLPSTPHAPNQRPRSFYVKMKRENPELYYSPANKAEMHRQAQTLGEAFFDVDE